MRKQKPLLAGTSVRRSRMRKSTFQDLSGKTFERLTVTTFAGRRGKRIIWNAVCLCGEKRVVVGDDLRSGHSRSCGCLAVDINSDMRATHRMKGTPTHISWQGLRNRCNNPNNPKFPRYGGRGITVCERWNSFENFLSDMGERPKGMTIERKDNNGNYEPGNCIWATPTQQGRNHSTTKLNMNLAREIRRMRASGKKIRVISERLEVPMHSVSNVIYGRSWNE